MAESRDDRLDVHVNIELTATALSTIVKNAKRIAGRDARGGYRIDTAGLVGQMVSVFLEKNGFEEFVKDPANYPELE
ncbi:MAG: hypothetical protein B5M56_06695 [Desulfococcus sp. 4484_241]|nr:MAG: hypothetical protein B5M56_06695 [Desulfococcus sp. 4484_241]